MTIFWHGSGPLMRWENGALTIEDLNPSLKTTWRMTRFERLRAGFRLMLASLKS